VIMRVLRGYVFENAVLDGGPVHSVGRVGWYGSRSRRAGKLSSTPHVLGTHEHLTTAQTGGLSMTVESGPCFFAQKGV
jgi:hypothetical protein